MINPADLESIVADFEARLERDALAKMGTLGIISLIADWRKRAEALREREMSEWQPIDTAPKDGTKIWVYVPRRRGEALQAEASNPTKFQWWSTGIGALKPTHWMPLPKPPSAP